MTRRAEVAPLEDVQLDDALAIERLVSARPWSADTFREELHRADRCYLAALEDGELVGYAGLWVAADGAHVLTVAVAPTHRRRGHGTRLVVALLDAALARGVDAVTLEVRESDTSAQQLYRRAGFRAVGVRPGYYEDDGGNALIMWWHADGR